MQKIKNFYLSKSARERVMLMLLVWVFALVWLSYSISWQKEISEASDNLKLDIETAESLIMNKETFAKNLANAGESLDPSKAVSDLAEEVERMLMDVKAGQKAMSFDADKITPKMTVKTLRLSLANTSMRELVKLEKKILERSPYMSLSKADFSSDTKGNMSARYEISSFIFNSKN